MIERSRLVEWTRAELVGPSRPLLAPAVAEFTGTEFQDTIPLRSGPLAWRPVADGDLQEVLYFQRETPHRKYGAGVLHPGGTRVITSPDQAAAEAADTVGVDAADRTDESGETDEGLGDVEREEGDLTSDEFEVTSPDVRRPSTIGISCCVRFDEPAGRLTIRLPVARRFHWQIEEDAAFLVNGRYERCTRGWTDEGGRSMDAPIWRRRAALEQDTSIEIARAELVDGKVVARDVPMPAESPVRLRVEVFPRRRKDVDGGWLVTVVLRNTSQPSQVQDSRESILYQTYFEVLLSAGALERYPESQRPFEQLDSDEQSLALLYRESATWGIGHGCSAGWDAAPQEPPLLLYADVMPAVETPSMTPDIKDSHGKRIQLSMRELAGLSDDGDSPAWQSLSRLVIEYASWLEQKREELNTLPPRMQPVGGRHVEAAEACLRRIQRGIAVLRENPRARRAFRLANLAMLLQQIATKQLKRRPLEWDAVAAVIAPSGAHGSPWTIFQDSRESPGLGIWRAFQIAFLLMSLDGASNGGSEDREIVDLIWFPTGGGKTEAYLGVAAFYMFHERLLMEEEASSPPGDGTNVLMRYTLRMLTTQQFQRAASLICAMEFLRRNPALHEIGTVPGNRFSLGLWIGGDGSPNKVVQARAELAAFKTDKRKGNPLVLTECPWCRGEIGRYEGPRPSAIPQNQWKVRRIRGITDLPTEGPLLLCPDGACTFGSEHWRNWLPIEVIDERIYANPPSLVIGTADKFAMIAFRPQAGAIFGRMIQGGNPKQSHKAPGLIIQDELHLISGPLGTIYGLYEAVFERLCSYKAGTRWRKPKLIASTATIRGAADQTKALYARTHTQLFPSPGLLMADSFFGTYARTDDGVLQPGRMYLGIHTSDYGSVLTTQVRTFSSVLFRSRSFSPGRRDPWWSLLVFYNSIRELGGATTLFASDIRSRLKFVFNRENVAPDSRRHLRIVDELTSRLSQAEIVGMMDRLATEYVENDNQALDACLASNIIEVGVDIERLSLMGVVGQPKTTAQYIQVTGRVGRRWWERPGLILTIYNPSKSRDRSHFEQFHSYHRRLYERVEPTSATPFALSAIQRALPGVLIAWARQHSDAPVQSFDVYERALAEGYRLMRERCEAVQSAEDQHRSLEELERVRLDIEAKWSQNPQEWEEFPPSVNGEYLLLWPGQFATLIQKQRGIVTLSSMRQVDGSGELTITQAYSANSTQSTP